MLLKSMHWLHEQDHVQPHLTFIILMQILILRVFIWGLRLLHVLIIRSTLLAHTTKQALHVHPKDWSTADCPCVLLAH